MNDDDLREKVDKAIEMWQTRPDHLTGYETRTQDIPAPHVTSAYDHIKALMDDLKERTTIYERDFTANAKAFVNGDFDLETYTTRLTSIKATYETDRAQIEDQIKLLRALRGANDGS